MKTALISIIVPIYKVPEPFLRQCIESCINQILQDIEIILVDDGSPDNCGKICDEYAAKDRRIRVIHKENGGLVSARNAGYDAVSGVWHMYIDGDDWIDVDTCEKLACYIEKYPNIDIIFWKCVQELGNHSIKGKWEWACEEEEHLYVGEECKELARNTLVYKSGIASPVLRLVRTEYALNHNIRHNPLLRQGVEGLDFSLRSFYHASNALYVNAYWYHYVYNSNSISKKVDEKNSIHITDCLKVIENEINQFANPTLYRKALYQRTIYILIALALNTYFHPQNKDKLSLRINKFSTLINNYHLYLDSIKYASLEEVDFFRKIVIIILRLKLYFLLYPIGWTKQAMLKKGYYNY